MAFKYRRKGSPFWWWSYLDPATGKRRYESLHLATDSREGTRKAMQLVQRQNIAELAISKIDKAEAWDAWVPNFINQRSYGKCKPLQRTLPQRLEKPQPVHQRPQHPLSSAV